MNLEALTLCYLPLQHSSVSELRLLKELPNVGAADEGRLQSCPKNLSISHNFRPSNTSAKNEILKTSLQSHEVPIIQRTVAPIALRSHVVTMNLPNRQQRNPERATRRFTHTHTQEITDSADLAANQPQAEDFNRKKTTRQCYAIPFFAHTAPRNAQPLEGNTGTRLPS